MNRSSKKMRREERLAVLNMLRTEMVRRHERPEIIHAVSQAYLRGKCRMEAAARRK